MQAKVNRCSIKNGALESSRERFCKLQVLALGLALVGSGCQSAVPPASLAPSAQPAVAETNPDIARTQSEMLSKDGISLVWRTDVPHPGYCAYTVPSSGDAGAVAVFAGKVEEEMGKYSRSALTAMHLTRIAIYENLAVQGQPRAAMPDPDSGTLFLDYKLGDDDDAYQRHVIHHELFHYMMGVLHNDMQFHDSAWAGLNLPGFQYGNGGVNQRESSSAVLDHPMTGFVDGYAESAQEEDMAEIEACRLVRSEDKLLEGWMAKDSVLRSKYLRLLEILKPLGVQ